jgi:hypothetical protein
MKLLKNLFLIFFSISTIFTSGCSAITGTSPLEDNSYSEAKTDSKSEVKFRDVSIWGTCDEENSIGSIGGSEKILVCEKDGDNLSWWVQNENEILTEGDSCFDSSNDQPMYTDGLTIASRLICIDNVLRSYPKFDSFDYIEVSERELKLALKNSSENTGKQIVVYGRIFGMNIEGQFQAWVSFKNHSDKFDYGYLDTFFYAESEMTKELVVDDEFKAWVRVRPHTTFEREIGGDSISPALRVDAIERIN